MKVNGRPYRTVWMDDESTGEFKIIDQRWLPFRFEVETIRTTEEAAAAIKDMHVRGAGCIGAVAAHAMYIAAFESEKSAGKIFEEELRQKADFLASTRPTAVNLQWAISRQLDEILSQDSISDGAKKARSVAQQIADEDAEWCNRIGQHGKPIIEDLAKKNPGRPINILTHCNAGWLAFVDHGSATAPIYAAHDAGIPVHVWVDETRPRNQGARLTAWELNQHGVPHTVIVDNTGGHLMQNGMVDLVITGTDRTTYTGDVANKIGTYLKALAAKDNEVPFYVALPSSTFDWQIRDGVKEIPIEKRDGDEVSMMSGLSDRSGDRETEVAIVSPGSEVANYAFDVTPSRLVTGLITERGVCDANETSILNLFPEHKK
ncbi:MAG: S-methyl-5-thioribose-1-phosphate isomerase [Verrucomicrobiales bacterium]|nr:S-methyl-5-thioribose-1-phosphate isomerase [Verrucomicrobiales bacterium]